MASNKKPRIPAATYDKIINLHTKGVADKDVADALDVSRATVNDLCSIYDTLRKGGTLSDNQRRRVKNIKHVCKILGLDPDSVLPAETEQMSIIPAEAEKQTAFAELLMECVKEVTAAVRAIDDRLSAMQMIMQGHRGEARVYTDKIVETINLNGDIVSKEHRVVEEKLERIQINTKRLRRTDSERDSV